MAERPTTSQISSTPAASINTKSPLQYAPTTIIYTDTVISTILPSPSNYPSGRSNVSETDIPSSSSSSNYSWEQKVHGFLPVIIAFAILGVLAVLGCMIFLACRFYRTRNDNNEDNTTIHCTPTFNEKKKPFSSPVHFLSKWLGATTETPYQQRQVEPIRYEKSDIQRINGTTSRRPSLAPSWLVRLIPSLSAPPPKRHRSLPIITQSRPSDVIDNLNIPISSTFVPIDSSSLTLVPRSEIWLDPDRRRGVDELDMWERRKSPIAPQPILWRFPQDNEYPDSPPEARFIHIDTRRSSTTMQGGGASFEQMMLEPETSETINDTQSLPQYQDTSSDVRLARTVLERSRLNNSSSKWLHFSGSRSF